LLCRCGDDDFPVDASHLHASWSRVSQANVACPERTGQGPSSAYGWPISGTVTFDDKDIGTYGQHGLRDYYRQVLLDVRLLIADEIISMLDASTRVDILNLLVTLKRSGLAILFITHDLSLGNYVSDQARLLPPLRGVLTTWPARPARACPSGHRGPAPASPGHQDLCTFACTYLCTSK